MKRHTITPRHDWRAKVETLGFNFHTLNNEKYWDEGACYEFDVTEITAIEKATQEVYDMCLAAIDHVLKNNLLDLFQIPQAFHEKINASWTKRSPSIYGRFDFGWDGSEHVAPKMFEFNADTPTSLFEAGVVQWFWLKEHNKAADQFNSIHEKLIAAWSRMRPALQGHPLYFSCLAEFPEDVVTVNYLRDCASQAGIETSFIDIHDIGRSSRYFTDLHEQPLHNAFKLYPWEWMLHEEFGELICTMETNWIEPPWKMILSNKAILPVLWQLFPGHPNLLECYFDHSGPLKDYVVKPLLSREGANVTIVENDKVVTQTSGDYGDEGYIYQKLYRLPAFDGNFPVIGSWIIDGHPAGIGLRETSTLVTDNFSRFVPHLIL